MALSETAYSHLVAWLKVVLPLTALAILSTLFLLARTPNVEQAIPYADVDVDALAREPRMSRPDFSGVAPDGTALQMTAATARPDPSDPGLFHAETLDGQIDTPEGTRIRMRAISATVDTGRGTATLAGDVFLETSTGYAVRTEEFTARLDATLSESNGPVDVMTPFGHMTAGNFAMTRDADNPESHVLVFSQGVDLLYDPRN
jgi:lipopolysaccharide export system protein LptC